MSCLRFRTRLPQKWKGCWLGESLFRHEIYIVRSVRESENLATEPSSVSRFLIHP